MLRVASLLAMTIEQAGDDNGHRLHPVSETPAGALRAAPRRRCADPRASAVGMVRPRADAGRGHGARQYGPRSARPGARALLPTPPRSKARATTRTSSPICATSGSTAICCCVEQPNGDFARTMVRQFFYAAFADLYWRAMMNSSDATLAAIAAKSEKESAYHLRHSSEWIVRLGDGTEESHAARRPRSTISGPLPARCSRSTTASAA